MTRRRLPLTLGLALALLASGATAYTNPTGVAVIIGNRHYEGTIPEVAYAHRDAEAFKRYVLDTLGYDPEHVIDLRDATQSQMEATFGNEASVEGNLWSFLDPAGGSDVLVFYSGHGVPGQRDGKGYLLPTDADPNVPELNAYAIDLLYANLAKLEGTGSVAVFLDACYTGGSQGGPVIENFSPVSVTVALPTMVAGTMTVLMAVSRGQTASWDTTARHGMFTHHLLDALYGKGDADADGRVSAAEAKRYLDRHMTRAARRAYKRHQVPILLGDGDMPLAFSGDAGYRPRPALGPGGVSAADIEELDGVRWAKQRANLRSGPSTEHPVAGSLDAGEEVAMKGRVRGGEWLLVATAEGNEAFVFARLLDDRRSSVDPSPQVPSAQAPARDTALEAAFWESVKDGDAAGFEAYLQQFPDGTFAPLALARLRVLVWAPMENSSAPEVFEEYLARNPDGHFAALARGRLQVVAWEAIHADSDFGVFWEYLRRFPDSPHVDEAEQRLRDAIGASSDVDALDRFARQRAASAFARDARQRAATLERLVRRLKTQFVALNEYGGIWFGRDCSDCPEMAVVPAGPYRMGSQNDQHGVTIGAPFAVGRYEVTFEEWDACARDGGCRIAEDARGWGRGRHPVIYVSWDDAERYVQWLSRKTRKSYRLLSESEWEYAARAGTETAYSWGDEIGVNRANCDGCGSQWDDSKTTPVGSFGANAWGLHDMHGNVWEWVDDCWNDSYAGAPADGSAWLRGNCDLRVLRGGSWDVKPSGLRAAVRGRNTTSFRSGSYGFRVARTLAP